MVRGKSRDQSFLLGQYVNDRPYVASSFMSVAISQVFGSAMSGRCKDREELVTVPIPLTARIDVLPVRGGEGLVQRFFEPLGYRVRFVPVGPMDEQVGSPTQMGVFEQLPVFSLEGGGNG